MRVFLFAGGGTGGHISPAIAVAEAVEARLGSSVEVHFAATPRPVDRRMYGGYGERVHYLDPPRIDGGLRGVLRFATGAARAFGAARKLIRELGPEAILCTGGYSSFFCAAVGRTLGVPVLLHESNAIPGRANRAAARFADGVLLGFRRAAAFFGKGTATVTGNPVRSCLKALPAGEAAVRIGLEETQEPVILFLGGSQGARALNDLALSAPEGIRIVLQCGERDMERMNAVAAGRRGFVVRAFEDDPSALYSCASLAVARAGAMTLAELCRFSLPSILIPYPSAALDHQTANAEAAAETGGALIVRESGLDTRAFWELVSGLLADRSRLASMSAGMGVLFPPDSAGTVAGLLIEAGGSGR